MLYFVEGKTPKNVGVVYGVGVRNGNNYCEMCGKWIDDETHLAHVEGRGSNFKNENGRNPEFIGWDELVVICDEDEA